MRGNGGRMTKIENIGLGRRVYDTHAHQSRTRRAVARAAEALRKAADALGDLESIALECGLTENQCLQESRFRSELRERAGWWEDAKWWRA